MAENSAIVAVSLWVTDKTTFGDALFDKWYTNKCVAEALYSVDDGMRDVG